MYKTTIRRLSLVFALAGVGCGTEPSGILTVTLDEVPEFTATTSIQVSGSVTRDPVAETLIFVTIAGGTETVSDTVQDRFDFAVELNDNQENQLAVTARDLTGTVSNPVVIVIVHDDTGPQVASSVPADKGSGVPLDTRIELRFAEALVQTDANASFTLRQNSRPVPGTATLSGDKTLFTFQPDEVLEPHSIYEMDVKGFVDEAGNLAGDGRNVCFITTSDGLQTHTTTDTSTVGFFGTVQPRNLIGANLLGAVLARSDSTLYGIFEFARERSLQGEEDRASVILDIDLDGSATTGFTSFKDFVFDANFSELNSGLKTELVVSIDGHGVLFDSGFVGVALSDTLTWDVIDAFLPGVCGRFLGFHTTTVFGDPTMDTGRFSYTYLAVAVEDPFEDESAFFLDPVPVAGHFDAELTDSGARPHERPRLVRSREEVRLRRIEASYLRFLRLLRSR